MPILQSNNNIFKAGNNLLVAHKNLITVENASLKGRAISIQNKIIWINGRSGGVKTNITQYNNGISTSLGTSSYGLCFVSSTEQYYSTGHTLYNLYNNHSIAIAGDGRYMSLSDDWIIIAAWQDGKVVVVDRDTFTVYKTITVPIISVSGAAYSPVANAIYAVNITGSVVKIDCNSWTVVSSYNDGFNRSSLFYSKYNNKFISCGWYSNAAILVMNDDFNVLNKIMCAYSIQGIAEYNAHTLYAVGETDGLIKIIY